MKKKTVTIISAGFNEEPNVSKFFNKIKSLKINSNISINFILVDDGSVDNTWNEMKKISKKNKNVRCIKLSRNFGKELALSAGVSKAQDDAAIIIDMDLQHPVRLIPNMINLWCNKDIYVVEAIKYKRQTETIAKKFFSNFFYKVFYIFSDLKIDNASDYKLLDKKVLYDLKNISETRPFFRGIIAWLGYESIKITYTPQERKFGKTKWSNFRLVNFALYNIFSFSGKPLILIWISAFIFLFIAILLSSKILYLYFNGEYVPGFTTVYMIQFIMGSLLLFCLSIISNYIHQISEAIKRRPLYIIAEDTKSKNYK